MHIAVIAALQEELAHLAAALHCTDGDPAGVTGTLAGHRVTLAQCGVGKVAAAITTSRLLATGTIDAVINTGVAGAVDPGLQQGDLVLAATLRQHDVDVTAFGFAPGQLFAGPVAFHSDPQLLAVARETLAADNRHSGSWHEGTIATGDHFVAGAAAAEALLARFPDTLAVEMEGAAIAQACAAFDTPCLVLRCISDQVAEPGNPAAFEQWLPQAAARSAGQVLALLQRLPQQP